METTKNQEPRTCYTANPGFRNSGGSYYLARITENVPGFVSLKHLKSKSYNKVQKMARQMNEALGISDTDRQFIVQSSMDAQKRMESKAKSVEIDNIAQLPQEVEVNQEK